MVVLFTTEIARKLCEAMQCDFLYEILFVLLNITQAELVTAMIVLIMLTMQYIYCGSSQADIILFEKKTLLYLNFFQNF